MCSLCILNECRTDGKASSLKQQAYLKNKNKKSLWWFFTVKEVYYSVCVRREWGPFLGCMLLTW